MVRGRDRRWPLDHRGGTRWRCGSEYAGCNRPRPLTSPVGPVHCYEAIGSSKRLLIDLGPGRSEVPPSRGSFHVEPEIIGHAVVLPAPNPAVMTPSPLRLEIREEAGADGP